MGTFWRAILKFFKWTVFLAIAIIVVASAYFAYVKNRELGYQSKLDWKFQNGWFSDGTQETLQTLESGKKIVLLRRVYIDRSSEVRAVVGPNGTLEAAAYFYVDCEPDTVIETSVRYSSDDKPVKLVCEKTPTTGSTKLVTKAFWEDGPKNVVWSYDFDGYRVHENFGSSWEWSWEKARRVNTLNRAKRPSEG